MKETGVIMSGNHPRLVLDLLKTMTRRTWGLEEINKNPNDWECLGVPYGIWRFQNKITKEYITIKCPYGGVGDILIIKEAWAADKLWDDKKPSEINRLSSIWYPADGQAKPMWVGRTRSARFMCNWMSRIRTEITELRAEHLNSMTESDAYLEGVDSLVTFMLLWDRLNKKRGYEWTSDCWVWVLTFKLCQ